MEDHEFIMGRGSPDDDADYQCAERGNGLDETYGDVISETDGGKRGVAL